MTLAERIEAELDALYIEIGEAWDADQLVQEISDALTGAGLAVSDANIAAVVAALAAER